MALDEWIEAVSGIVGGFDALQHLCGNHTVTMEDEHRATCICYVQGQHYLLPETMARLDRAGETNWCMVGATVTHSLLRFPEGWRIRSARLSVSWVTGNRGVFELVHQRQPTAGS